MSGRRTSRLAASFNATLAGSQVQGLLDGASISSNEGVSGIVPQGADQLLDDVTTHSSEMDHDDDQGPVRPEILTIHITLAHQITLQVSLTQQ